MHRPTRLFPLLAAIGALFGGRREHIPSRARAPNAGGHRGSSTGSTARNTGPAAKRAEKRRRRLTRRAR